MEVSFVCPVCGQRHDELPHISTDFPEPYFTIPEDQHDKRVMWTPDLCIIDGEEHFIRGIVEIPIDDYPQPLGFNAWISQSREDFTAYARDFTATDIGPFSGYFATRLACYSRPTLFIAATVHFRGGGMRPKIIINHADHPLAVDQRTGITLSMACQMVHYFD